ncbi:hypothetical protein GCM10011344_33310 [Dokdonia pacifica]|uniref:Uncharacterized protein n=1 Tax=Dokdonia pacifica TaxID=1627892 RepID=A0A239BH83_9FLAO|nr:hypothetical protein [Dokdonia pacifica]GGG29756.1 hypothetical protein GCM10011344_33310 [Dokdonia pacifica]SNS06474.1 hypothetical protein SAMN06265376_106126 [Dokdonia pacifica]
MISEKRIPFSYKRLRYFLYMGIAWTTLGVIILVLILLQPFFKGIIFERDFGFLLTSIPFWKVLIAIGGIHILFWLVFKFNAYVIIDKKSITQNKILYLNRLFFDEIEHIDEYAGDYTFYGKSGKITLRKTSFTPYDHDSIKELAERLNAEK